MDTQQALNIGLMKEFQSRGIEFAFPTRIVRIDLPTAVANREVEVQ